MKITHRQLRRIIREAFAATAEEEAKKINREAGVSLVTDQAFWEESGITTGEDLAREMLASTYSDYYKSLRGVRPRWMNFKEMTVNEIQAALDRLDDEAMSPEDDAWESEDRGLDLEDKVIAAVHAHPEDIPDEYLEYERMPARSGMGRRF